MNQPILTQFLMTLLLVGALYNNSQASGQTHAQTNPFDDYSNHFKICMDKAVSTVDIIECVNGEFRDQDKRLNQAYRALISKQTSQRVHQLTELQKLWIKYRDANCDFYYDPDGGSMARIRANDCLLSMTKDRANELEGMMIP